MGMLWLQIAVRRSLLCECAPARSADRLRALAAVAAALPMSRLCGASSKRPYWTSTSLRPVLQLAIYEVATG